MDPAVRDDALAQASRARLFRLLGELQRPASTEELAERLGLHPNGVRTHLERLDDAGLVVRGRERRPRGRPRDVWTIDPQAGPSGDPPGAYADLSRWLVRTIAARKSRVRDVESMGHEIGRELASKERPVRRRSVCTERSRHSASDPHVPSIATGSWTTRWRTVRTATLCVRTSPSTCALHRGLTRGLLAGISPDTELTAFVPRDPDTAGCLIQLDGPLADEAAARLADAP